MALYILGNFPSVQEWEWGGVYRIGQRSKHSHLLGKKQDIRIHQNHNQWKSVHIFLVHILSHEEKLYRIQDIILFQGNTWLQGIPVDLRQGNSHPQALYLRFKQFGPTQQSLVTVIIKLLEYSGSKQKSVISIKHTMDFKNLVQKKNVQYFIINFILIIHCNAIILDVLG